MKEIIHHHKIYNYHKLYKLLLICIGNIAINGNSCTIEQTTWIEHYGNESYGFSIDERVDWVKLERDADRLVCPVWRAGSREELEGLIGQAFMG
jgi:hypothetical protein